MSSVRKKMEGYGEVGDSKKEKRRLVSSDSDSDGHLVSFREVESGTALDGDSSSINKGCVTEPIKLEEKSEVDNKQMKVPRSDVLNRNEELLFADEKEVILRPDLERKRRGELLVANVIAKKPKPEFSEPGERKISPTSAKNSNSSSFYHVYDRKKMKADKYAGSKLSRKSNGARENQTQPNSHKASKMETEEVGRIEWLDNRVVWMKDSGSKLTADKIADTCISERKGDVLRVQGKGGVLKVLLSNKKVDGLENLRPKSRNEDKSKALESPTLGTSKRPSLSADQRVHENSSSKATLSKTDIRKIKTERPEESRSNEPRTETKIFSAEREKNSANLQNRRTNSKVQSSSSSKSIFVAKEISNKANAASKTDKQKLRDQIRSILVNTGWTIDLRPRKDSKYVDSVYIPPDGRGSYWSITKAYAVYKEQVSKACNEQGKNPSGRSSRASSGSDCIVPMESLNILKRIVVNKRRRGEDLEEAQRGKNKKVKKSFESRHPGDQDVNDKHDEFSGRNKSSRAFSSNTKNAVGLTANKHLETGKIKQRGCALLARGSNHEAETEDNDYVPYVWKRTVLSWMIDMGVLPLNGRVKYMNQKKTKTKLEGRITRDGIHCCCCSKILTLSKFELHAGSKLLQPSQNIFLEDGVSLLQCQLDAWKRQDESERPGFYTIYANGDDPNDDTCGICGDGGDLICCDGCPSTFHLSCLSIKMLPPGDWHCTNCCCRFCGGISTDATQESDGTVSSLLCCTQCEAKYHQDCVPEIESASVISRSQEISFCTQSCRKVFKRLQKILGTKNDLGAGFSWCVSRCFDEDASRSQLRSHQIAECNSKIAVAFAVMDECFLPIIDQRSGVNLIHNVVYNCGSNFNRLNYRGFYTFILERGDEIISVASIRIHGTRLAEMPFIGTRNMYRRQGMCRRLLHGIELALGSINVKKLVIPAISELKDTWINVFGFKPLEISQELEVRSINILVFPGTGLLQKPLLKMHSSELHAPVDRVGMVEYGTKHQHQTDLTRESSEPSTTEPNLHDSGQADFQEGLTGFYDGDKFLVDFPSDQKTELANELTLVDNHERKEVEANMSTDLQECDAVSKHTSPNGIASAFQASGVS